MDLTTSLKLLYRTLIGSHVAMTSIEANQRLRIKGHTREGFQADNIFLQFVFHCLCINGNQKNEQKSKKKKVVT